MSLGGSANNMDELLAQSLAMEDYMDFMNTPSQTTTPSSNNSNNSNNNNIAPLPIQQTTNTSKTNPNPSPKILNQQCLPSILQRYITSKSIMNLSDDVNSINPNIHNLFIKYNYLYFDNKLSQCEVKWSKRMTLCAGLCCYEGQGGLCSIKLSSSLLKYRSTKEMIETLIHEMIHGFLFVTYNNRDRASHGDRFKTLMNVINYASNLNISIYHTFHDEVDEYRKHIWKCCGPCQYKQPYFGLVKRAMNRPPGPNDNWWMRHKQQCGGQYVKISEPKEFTEKQKKKKEREERKRRKEEEKKKRDGIDGEEKEKKRKKKKIAGKKRKRGDINDNGNGRTLLDMFDVVKDDKDEPVKKKRRVDVVDNGSDLEILDNDDNNNNNNNGNGKNVQDMNNGNEVSVKCPICGKLLAESMINLHLDDCLR